MIALCAQAMPVPGYFAPCANVWTSRCHGRRYVGDAEMMDGDSSREFSSVTSLITRYNQLGHALRGELISRWYALGNDGTVSEAEAISQLDFAEKRMNSVMQNRSFLPSRYIYLLYYRAWMRAEAVTSKKVLLDIIISTF